MPILIATALVILLCMVYEALSVAIANYVFLDGGFWDGWHAAWDRPGYLFLFALAFLFLRGGSD